MKFHLYLTAALAAASLAACQPAPAPETSEPTTAGAEAPTNTEAASTVIAQPTSESITAGTTTSFPADCPLIAARNWEARSRPGPYSAQIEVTGEIDVRARPGPVSLQQFPSRPGATGLRFELLIEQSPPGEIPDVRTALVDGRGSDREGRTRVNIFCDGTDRIIADIPITVIAP